MHELGKHVDSEPDLATAENRFLVRQLEAAERRSLFIVRAMTCFYASVAAFVTATLLTLIGALLGSAISVPSVVRLVYASALCAGFAGACGLILGALLLVRETRESFIVLKEENRIVAGKLNRSHTI